MSRNLLLLLSMKSGRWSISRLDFKSIERNAGACMNEAKCDYYVLLCYDSRSTGFFFQFCSDFSVVENSQMR